MRHLLLLLLPVMLMSQKNNAIVGGTTDETIPRLQVAGSDNAVTGTTTLVIRGSGAAQGSMPLTTWQAPLVWRSSDGKPYTQGPSGHLIPYHAPVTISKPPRWTYAAYGAAVGADYLSTRYALSHGATDAMYRCNPHRPGCLNQAAFWAVAAVPVAMWILHDLWFGKHTSDRWRRIESVFRKVVIGGRAGVAAYNGGVAQGIAGSR